MSIILKQLLMKQAVKEGAKRSGIMTINKNIVRDVEKLYQKYVKDALAQGVDLDTLSPDQLKMIVAMNQPKPPKVFSGQEAMDQLNKLFPKKGEVVDMTGKKIDTSQGIMGGKSVTEILESGQVQKGTQGLKKSDKVVEREMFEEANNKFNQTDIVADSVARITSMEPVTALKEANKIIKREGIYKNLDETQSKKILQDTEDWINERDIADRWDYNKNRPFRDDPDFDPDDPDYIQRMKDEDAPDYAKGGRAGYYTGGITNVEPKLDDIGHGSDSLMSRTRLMSPGSQATTSTGLNYLLAEDNDNIRVPFGGGGFNAARRAFLKMMGVGAAGVGAAKSGLFSLLKGGGKKEVIKELTEVPIKDIKGMPSWFKPLVNKIIKEGEQMKVTEYDRLITHKSKLPNSKTEIYVNQDLNNGDVWVEIGKDKHGWADGKFGQPVKLQYKAAEDIEPVLTKKGKTEFKGGKTKEEFNVEEAEFTGGHPENVKFEETSVNKFGQHDSNFDEVETFATGIVRTKKASGGRAGFSGGHIVKGGNWLIKSLLDTRQQLKTMRLSPGQLKQYLDQIDDQIKNIEAGGKIPDEVIQTIRKDPKFKSVWQNQKSADPDLREMEEVLLEYGQKHASGGLAKMLGE